MAGEYVEFVNNSQPALNEDNLNLMQQRIKQDIVGTIGGDTLPIGTIVKFGTNNIPENWLLCNGQAVSRTIYQDLFNTIGITYGQGDGFTTFNLPNIEEQNFYYIIKAKQSAGVVATVVDNLNSTSTTDALSANQGKIINEKIQELTTYSTEEQVVGTWIDGNPIYRKSFNIGNVTSDVEINTNITNFAELISATGRGKLENQYWATLPQINIQASGVYFAINLNNDGSKIQIKRSSNSFRSVVIILEYTKTTN